MGCLELINSEGERRTVGKPSLADDDLLNGGQQTAHPNDSVAVREGDSPADLRSVDTSGERDGRCETKGQKVRSSQASFLVEWNELQEQRRTVEKDKRSAEQRERVTEAISPS